MSREAKIERATRETEVTVEVDLDGGEVAPATSVGFLDHMLELLGRHGRLGLRASARGDLETGAHHTVEDVGIAIGQALDGALGDRAGIHRYGHAVAPMDEALAELTEEFFRAVASNAKLTLHLKARYGSNVHHQIEACFKAFARALREAVAIDPEEAGVPSTKGTLT